MRASTGSDDRSPRKPWYRRWFGSRAERAAERHLKSLGYKVLARNFSCQLGELDLVARDGETIVFVEVRSTEGADATRPAESIDRRKQARLTRLALYFLQSRRLLNSAARFDAIVVRWPPDRTSPEIVHWKNAFEAVGNVGMYS